MPTSKKIELGIVRFQKEKRAPMEHAPAQRVKLKKETKPNRERPRMTKLRSGETLNGSKFLKDFEY